MEDVRMRPCLFLLVWFLREPRCVQRRKVESREFPGGLVVRTPCFHCRTAADMGSLPGGVTKILHASRRGHKKKQKKKKVILPFLLEQELAPNRRESNSLRWSVTSSAPVLRTLTIKHAVTSGPALPPRRRSKAGWRHLGPGPAFQCNPPLAHSLPQSALTDYLGERNALCVLEFTLHHVPRLADSFFKSKASHYGELLGGSAVRTPRRHYRGHRFDPWSGNWDPARLTTRPINQSVTNKKK